MSVIIHRCACGHCDMSHSDTSSECSTAWCKCGNARPAVVANYAPEVVATYDVATGDPVPTITPPGSLWGGGTRATGRITCACERCAALHQSLGGVA